MTDSVANENQQPLSARPEGTYIQKCRGHNYVITRKFVYNKETKKSTEKREYLGQMVNGVYYSQEDYKRCFSQGMKPREAPSLSDMFNQAMHDQTLIEQLTPNQIEYLFGTIDSGSAGVVPLLWNLAKTKGLYGQLLNSFPAPLVVNKCLSIASYFIETGDNSALHYPDFANICNLQCC